MKQLYRIVRFRRALAVSARFASTQPTRSPRQLYDHLSDYIVGQDKAKRTLSVAVFNHYLRIAPPPETEPTLSPPPRPSTTGESLKSSTVITPDSKPFGKTTPAPSSTSINCTASSSLTATASSSSRSAGNDIAPSGDSFFVPSDGDQTVVHQLTADTPERDWARDPFYSSRNGLSPPTQLGKALRKRKTPLTSGQYPSSVQDPSILAVPTSSLPSSSSIYASDQSEVYSYGGDAARRIRMHGPNLDEIQARPAVVETDTADTERSDQDLRGGRKVEVEKSNVLMIGPTGTGKTLMTKTLARILDVPFATCDATTYTSAGYVGDDVETCILRLLQAADYDVSRAERGIIHIDEIDKLARRGAGDGFATYGRDVGGEGVQQALLRLLEGTTVTLQAKPPPISSKADGPLGKDSSESWGSDASLKSGLAGLGPPPKKGVREGLPGHGGGGSGGKAETFVVDTSNILFICSGAFVGLENLVNSRIGKGSMGFGARLPTPPSDASQQSTSQTALQGLSTPDLTQYGLIPEFLGRLPIISTLHPLSTSDLVRILQEPRNALIKQYQTIFEQYGSELRFTRKALEAIAREGLKRGGGARGLRGVLEEVLGDAMFEVPGSGVRYCLISEDVVKKEREAQYFSRGQKFLVEQAVLEEDGPVKVEPLEDEWEGEEDERLRASG